MVVVGVIARRWAWWRVSEEGVGVALFFWFNLVVLQFVLRGNGMEKVLLFVSRYRCNGLLSFVCFVCVIVMCVRCWVFPWKAMERKMGKQTGENDFKEVDC